MEKAIKELPEDVATLQRMLIQQAGEHNKVLVQYEQLQADKKAVVQDNTHLKSQVLTLTEKLHLALAYRYAASSEKISPDQIRLFDEAEVETPITQEGTTRVPAHSRKKPGRKKLPETLPRVEVLYELAEHERVCPHDGKILKEIGDVVSEQLDIIPAKIQVIRNIRKKYACDCGRCIKTAALPVQPIPKSLASPGLLAHITVSKYQDALPLYRQETILQRIGVEIPRATLANWMIQAGALIQPVINLLRDRLLGFDIVQMDETTVQVLNEAGKRAQSKSYLWVQRGGPPDKPVVLYDYDPGRGQAVPVRLLEDFTGYLQTDGYDGYNAVVKTNRLVHLGCMAHARRKFSEAVKAQGKKKKIGKAHKGLWLIQALYRVESQARHLTPEERFTYRVQHAKPLLDKIRSWLDQSLLQVPPQSTTGKALHYLHNEWDKLIVYLKDGRLEIDNNKTENAIRPFVVGRKNFLFSVSVKGVKASANLYSLIETAKANGLEPYAYLRTLYTELPKAESIEAIEALLPGNIKKNQITLN